MNILDVTNFESCVARGLQLLGYRKNQMEEEGYKFNTCLKAARWAIEQIVINRSPDSTMMSAVIDYVEMIESREMQENNI